MNVRRIALATLVCMVTVVGVADALPTRVTTDEASAVGVNSATISGSLSADTGTAYWLEYGPTTSYGSTTQHLLVGLDRAATVTEPISGLRSSTTYHVRIVAFDAAGLHPGRDVTFTTLPAFPPRATTLGVTVLSAQWVRADAGILPGATVTSYTVEFGLTTSYGSVSAATVVPGDAAPGRIFSVTLGPLKPSRLYHYRAIARNEKGVSRGRDRTFRSPAVSLAPEVQTLDATGVVEDLARLKGRVNSHYLETTYRFEYGRTTDYGHQTLTKTIPGNASIEGVSEPIQGLTPGTEYHYRLVATNVSGTGNGRDLTFRTRAVTPGVPDIETASYFVSATSVTATVVIRPNGAGRTRYALELGRTPSYGTPQVREVEASDTTIRIHDQLKVGGLQPLARFHVRVSATNRFGSTHTADSVVQTAGYASTLSAPFGVYEASIVVLPTRQVRLSYTTVPGPRLTANFYLKVQGAVQTYADGRTQCLYPAHITIELGPPTPCDSYHREGQITCVGDTPVPGGEYPRSRVIWPGPGVALWPGDYRVILSAVSSGTLVGAPLTLDFSIP
jgi:hypothetical protein